MGCLGTRLTVVDLILANIVSLIIITSLEGKISNTQNLYPVILRN
jgi:hypothetical protein